MECFDYHLILFEIFDSNIPLSIELYLLITLEILAVGKHWK